MKNQINRKQLIFMDWKFKMVKMASTSLVVQWLRLHTPNARALSLVPGQGTRPHMPQLKIQHSQINKHILYIYIYGSTPQANLQIQCNLYENDNWFFCRNCPSGPKIHVEIERAQNSQNNLLKNNKFGRLRPISKLATKL